MSASRWRTECANRAELDAGEPPLPVRFDEHVRGPELPVGGLASMRRLLSVPADHDRRPGAALRSVPVCALRCIGGRRRFASPPGGYPAPRGDIRRSRRTRGLPPSGGAIRMIGSVLTAFAADLRARLVGIGCRHLGDASFFPAPAEG